MYCDAKWGEHSGAATKWARSGDGQTVFHVCEACAKEAAELGWKVSDRRLKRKESAADREFRKAFTPNRFGEYA